MLDELKRAIQDALGSRPTPAQRRQLAAALRQIADKQEQLADADERSGVRVRASQKIEAHNQQRKTGRPKGTGARFVRVGPGISGSGVGHRSPTIHVGRALWQELGEPRRLDPQRLGSQVVLRPCAPGAGYAVTRPVNGMPRFSVGYEMLDILGLVEGQRYAAHIEGGAIVMDAA